MFFFNFEWMINNVIIMFFKSLGIFYIMIFEGVRVLRMVFGVIF